VVWLSVQEFFTWWLSGESKSGEGVHNHVYPEQLNSRQWSDLGDSRSNEDGEHSDNINSQLELQEFSNVVKDVSSELDGSHNRSEVVIHKNNVASFLRNLSSSDTHGKSDISLLKSWSIVSSITSYCNDLSEFLKSSNQNVFVLGR